MSVETFCQVADNPHELSLALAPVLHAYAEDESLCM
jgi:hypothetical protein